MFAVAEATHGSGMQSRGTGEFQLLSRSHSLRQECAGAGRDTFRPRPGLEYHLPSETFPLIPACHWKEKQNMAALSLETHTHTYVYGQHIIKCHCGPDHQR